MKQESLEEYENDDSYDDKGNDAGGGSNFDGDSSSLRFTDTREPSSMSHDLPTLKTILGMGGAPALQGVAIASP